MAVPARFKFSLTLYPSRHLVGSHPYRDTGAHASTGNSNRRCSEWAATTRGRIDLPGSSAPLALSVLAAQLPEPLRRWVGQGLLKDPARAAHKALACYGGDVSRLTDVTRCRVVFATLADLEACAVAICAAGSTGAVVVGGRSALTDAGGAGAAGGFRAVVLRVRFDTEEAREGGAENHVCEVQVRGPAGALSRSRLGRIAGELHRVGAGVWAFEPACAGTPCVSPHAARRSATRGRLEASLRPCAAWS